MFYSQSKPNFFKQSSTNCYSVLKKNKNRTFLTILLVKIPFGTILANGYSENKLRGCFHCVNYLN